MGYTVYPKKYAHGFVVLCLVVVMESFIMNSHQVFIHIHQGCFAGTGAIVRLPQCQWSKPDRYGKISRCITTTKHIKAKTVCIFLGIYCNCLALSRFVIDQVFFYFQLAKTRITTATTGHDGVTAKANTNITWGKTVPSLANYVKCTTKYKRINT